MFYIYRITNLINGMTYIGQHEYKKLNEWYMGRGKHLRAAQKEYGIKNFKKEILVFNISTQEHANLLEKVFIAAEREKVGIENCYNEANGGKGCSINKGSRCHSDIERAKITKGLYKHYETHCGPNKGKKFGPLSEEHKKKISESHKDKPCPHSEEWERKQSDNMKGRHWFTNDKVNKFSKTCPEGFHPGITNKK